MLRNDVTFKSKSVKNVYYLFKGVQIWYQNNIKQLAHYHWDIEILQQLPADGKKMLFFILEGKSIKHLKVELTIQIYI